MTRVNIHIDSLVLDGVELPPDRGPVLQAAVEAELQRLFTLDGAAGQYSAHDGASRVSGGDIQLAPDRKQNPHHLGKQIARAVKEGVEL
jgi:hypothetical protein